MRPNLCISSVHWFNIFVFFSKSKNIFALYFHFKVAGASAHIAGVSPPKSPGKMPTGFTQVYLNIAQKQEGYPHTLTARTISPGAALATQKPQVVKTKKVKF